MTRSSLLVRWSWFFPLGLALGSPNLARAQEPAPPPPAGTASASREQVPHGAPPVAPEHSVGQGMSLQPLPPVEIPTDPPPHEGAMIDIPIILEPPDIIVVEVLTALPGRPITGERLIRPDGKVSLGFYDDIHIRGLTIEQAKVKIVLHLRQFLTDEVLGLVKYQAEPEPAAEPAAEMPDGIPPVPVPRENRDPQPNVPSPPNSAQPRQTRQIQRPSLKPASQRSGRTGPAMTRTVALQQPVNDVAEAFQKQPRDPVESGGVLVDPQSTNRVYVDIVSHNTKVYYVQGDVQSPGRLPFTGKETVFDALTYAGGFLPTAEPTDIHLYRPGVGGKPARDYRIDHAAILRGEARANLQIFPNDRLIIGRNAIVQKTIEIDRAEALTHSIQVGYTQLNNALRSVNPNEINDNRLELPEYFETIWNGIAADPSILNDPDRFRDFMKGWLKKTRRPR